MYTDGEVTTDEYVCEACGERFASRRALERHVADVGLID
ncbi:MAG: C2H2-type zinc finger protein [Haloferacaceae archaeon]